jgi:nickel transport protein
MLRKSVWANLAACLLLVVCANAARAHGLDAQCTLRAGRVEVEAYYDDDTPAGRAKVRVLDNAGARVIDGRTDTVGRWSFMPPAPGEYRVIVDAGAGHRKEVMVKITAEQLAAADAGQVSSGPSREEFTSVPWLKTVIGLAAIAAFFVIVALVRRQRPRSPGAPGSRQNDATHH